MLQPGPLFSQNVASPMGKVDKTLQIKSIVRRKNNEVDSFFITGNFSFMAFNYCSPPDGFAIFSTAFSPNRSFSWVR